jgi:ribosomal subunit interface protein
MLPVQLTVRGFDITPAIETLTRKKVEKLEQFYGRIVACRVVIDFQQKNKHQGKLFSVRVDLTVPGKELVVSRKGDEDIYIAIRDAFDALTRQLEEHASKRHGRVKTHNHVMHGYVARIIPEEGYGFIEGIDGHEYYFSMTNMSHPEFEQLTIGDAVEYFPETLKQGRQAQHVLKERHRNHYQEAI